MVNLETHNDTFPLTRALIGILSDHPRFRKCTRNLPFGWEEAIEINKNFQIWGRTTHAHDSGLVRNCLIVTCIYHAYDIYRPLGRPSSKRVLLYRKYKDSSLIRVRLCCFVCSHTRQPRYIAIHYNTRHPYRILLSTRQRRV